MNYVKRKNLKKVASILLGVVIVIAIVAGIGVCTLVRFDPAAGSHKIIPTAVDTDFFGNYQVYYRTTEFTKDSEEPFYYIDKENTALADEVRECIKAGQTIMVYYDRYVGLKGITAPAESPIVRIEVIE